MIRSWFILFISSLTLVAGLFCTATRRRIYGLIKAREGSRRRTRGEIERAPRCANARHILSASQQVVQYGRDTNEVDGVTSAVVRDVQVLLASLLLVQLVVDGL